MQNRSIIIHTQLQLLNKGGKMLEILQKLNPELDLYDVNDIEFAPFGRVIKNLYTTEIIEEAKRIANPDSGASYLPSYENFEKLKIAEEIKNNYYGSLPTQIGYCWGHNSFMNATEWHTSSEINIAITPLVLILGHVWDINDGKIDSSKFKAFYLPEGTVVEVYATSLHFSPCEVEEGGFGCVVGLPKDTNTELAIESECRLLFRKNKWLIAHINNESLIKRGVIPGITGINYEIKYKGI